MDKRAARRECFARIKALSVKTKSKYSARIVDHLFSLPEFEVAKSVFTYYAMPSEPDLSGLFHSGPPRQWSFSRVTEHDRLSFHRVESFKELVEGPFGFLEPNPDTCLEVSEESADLILIPGVGFDTANFARLGRGKGHYDRFLEKALKQRPAPALVGVCFQTQLIDLIPESHDIPMATIITEEGVYSSGRGPCS